MTMRTRQNLLDLYPLTPVQQGILYHALARDGDDPYLLRVCFRLDGAVDPVALQRAWQAVIDRHEALRADVEWTRSDQPIQRVFRSCAVAIDQQHWSVPAEQVDVRLRALVGEEARRFSLQRAADQRVVLVHTAPGRSYLLWLVHHALLDGWSIANVLAELLAAYRAAAGGPPADLPPVPPYATYLGWLRAQDPAPAEAHWRTQLASYEPPAFPPPLPSPLPAAGPGYAERSIAFAIDESDQLRALARSAQVTLSACFQGAVALLLRAYTGRDDVVFGATVAGRPADLAGASAMVGAFINTVPVRVRLHGGDAVVPYLQRLHHDAGQRRAFEHLGLPRILELAAQPTGQPLFESILVFENFPVSDALDRADALPFGVAQHRTFDGSDSHGSGDLVLGRGRNHYPVTFVVLPGQRIELVLAYHRNRITDDAASEMLARLGAIVRNLARCSATTRLAPISEFFSMSSASSPSPASSTSTVAGSASNAGHALPVPRAIHERIGHWADATPNAIAVRYEDDTVCYAALEARADRLARELQARGVTPGARVGVCLPRSIDFIVALYAALKAGAAYVPLDPEHPRPRLAGLIDDARLAAMVTRRASLPRLEGLHPAVIACDDATASQPPGPRIRAAVHPESPAYVIYTSGSTGTPKGVVVSHRALDNYVAGVTARMALPAGASMAMVSTVAADLGHTALFGALCTGGALHLISDERTGDPDGFADYMARHQVAALKIVPGQLWGLMQTADPERALPAEVLVIGGEAAPPPLLERLRRQSRCRVINHYGPTETTVGILTHPVAPPAPGSAVDGTAPPLGRPLPHTQAHVLGPDLRPMPVGVAGEIFLGGAGLATGYLHRPDLTAERFVPDPRSGRPGGRLYQTGDRGRMRTDGAIDFLGRTDDQIKLRGFRIELGEVRAALVGLASVSDARVVVRPGPAGSSQLCAYLVAARVPGSTGVPADTELRAQLAARLPEPMIPSAFAWLDRFPVTANGKVDLARLPAPAPGAGPGASCSPAGAHRGAPPATEPERILAEIWSEILGNPQIGRDDDFFQLGGDSILALRVVARARRAGWKLTPKQLFANSTLAAAALAAQPITDGPAAPRASAAPVPPPPVPPPPAPRASDPAQLTPIQLRFLARQTTDPHHYNQALLLALARPIAPGLLERAIARLVAHHHALRLRFRRDGTTWRVWYAGPETTPASRSSPANPSSPAALAHPSGPANPASAGLVSGGASRPDRVAALLTDAGANATAAVVRIDLAGAVDPGVAIEGACDELQRSFDLSRGPLLRAAYLDLGPGREPRLLLVAHHLVVDGVSWRILLEDLAALLGDGDGDGGPALAAELPPPTTSFARWTELLHDHARGAALRDQLAYWQRVVASETTQAAIEAASNAAIDASTAPAPDHRLRSGDHTVAEVATASAELDARTTAALLSRAPRAHATRVNDLLLAALALALCRQWQRTSLVVTVEGHGREDLFDGVDLSRTVGWFSTLYPVRLTPVAGDRGATIAAIRDHLRRIPEGGVGYGVLQQLAPGAPLATAVEPAIAFNYLGQFDQAFAGQRLFRIAPESHGRRRSPRALREAPFVVNALVHDGVLGVDWEYSRAHHDRAEVEPLLAAFLDELRMLIRHCDELLGATP